MNVTECVNRAREINHLLLDARRAIKDPALPAVARSACIDLMAIAKRQRENWIELAWSLK